VKYSAVPFIFDPVGEGEIDGVDSDARLRCSRALATYANHGSRS
jgi:hypothetical protein